MRWALLGAVRTLVLLVAGSFCGAQSPSVSPRPSSPPSEPPSPSPPYPTSPHQPLPLSLIDIVTRVAFCAQITDSNCLGGELLWLIDLYPYPLTTGSASADSGLSCIGSNGTGCKWSTIDDYISTGGDNYTYIPVGLTIQAHNITRMLQLGHGQVYGQVYYAGYILRQLQTLSITCSQPTPVFAPYVLEPLIMALSAAGMDSGINRVAATPSPPPAPSGTARANTTSDASSGINSIILVFSRLYTRPTLEPSQLRSLSINDCNLTGPLPPASFWMQLPSLERLDLSRNQLSGSLPSTFGQSPPLSYLNLSHNHFTGPLTATLARYGGCNRMLDLSYNDLRGGVPDAWLSSACSLYGKDDIGLGARRRELQGQDQEVPRKHGPDGGIAKVVSSVSVSYKTASEVPPPLNAITESTGPTITALSTTNPTTTSDSYAFWLSYSMSDMYGSDGCPLYAVTWDIAATARVALQRNATPSGTMPLNFTVLLYGNPNLWSARGGVQTGYAVAASRHVRFDIQENSCTFFMPIKELLWMWGTFVAAILAVVVVALMQALVAILSGNRHRRVAPAVAAAAAADSVVSGDVASGHGEGRRRQAVAVAAAAAAGGVGRGSGGGGGGNGSGADVSIGTEGGGGEKLQDGTTHTTDAAMSGGGGATNGGGMAQLIIVAHARKYTVNTVRHLSVYGKALAEGIQVVGSCLLYSIPWVTFFRTIVTIAVHLGAAGLTFAMSRPQRREYCDSVRQCGSGLYVVPQILSAVAMGLTIFLMHATWKLAGHMACRVMDSSQYVATTAPGTEKDSAAAVTTDNLNPDGAGVHSSKVPRPPTHLGVETGVRQQAGESVAWNCGFENSREKLACGEDESSGSGPTNTSSGVGTGDSTYTTEPWRPPNTTTPLQPESLVSSFRVCQSASSPDSQPAGSPEGSEAPSPSATQGSLPTLGSVEEGISPGYEAGVSLPVPGPIKTPNRSIHITGSNLAATGVGAGTAGMTSGPSGSRTGSSTVRVNGGGRAPIESSAANANPMKASREASNPSLMTAGSILRAAATTDAGSKTRGGVRPGGRGVVGGGGGGGGGAVSEAVEAAEVSMYLESRQLHMQQQQYNCTASGVAPRARASLQSRPGPESFPGCESGCSPALRLEPASRDKTNRRQLSSEGMVTGGTQRCSVRATAVVTLAAEGEPVAEATESRPRIMEARHVYESEQEQQGGGGGSNVGGVTECDKSSSGRLPTNLKAGGRDKRLATTVSSDLTFTTNSGSKTGNGSSGVVVKSCSVGDGGASGNHCIAGTISSAPPAPSSTYFPASASRLLSAPDLEETPESDSPLPHSTAEPSRRTLFPSASLRATRRVRVTAEEPEVDAPPLRPPPPPSSSRNSAGGWCGSDAGDSGDGPKSIIQVPPHDQVVDALPGDTGPAHRGGLWTEDRLAALAATSAIGTMTSTSAVGVRMPSVAAARAVAHEGGVMHMRAHPESSASGDSGVNPRLQPEALRMVTSYLQEYTFGKVGSGWRVRIQQSLSSAGMVLLIFTPLAPLAAVVALFAALTIVVLSAADYCTAVLGGLHRLLKRPSNAPSSNTTSSSPSYSFLYSLQCEIGLLLALHTHVAAWVLCLPLAVFTSTLYALGYVWGKDAVPLTWVWLACNSACLAGVWLWLVDLSFHTPVWKRGVCSYPYTVVLQARDAAAPIIPAVPATEPQSGLRQS